MAPGPDEAAGKPARRRRTAKPVEDGPEAGVAPDSEEAVKPARRRRTAKPVEDGSEAGVAPDSDGGGQAGASAPDGKAH